MYGSNMEEKNVTSIVVLIINKGVSKDLWKMEENIKRNFILISFAKSKFCTILHLW